jgi:hypothetical protein
MKDTYIKPEHAKREVERATRLAHELNEALRDVFIGKDAQAVENATFLWFASFIYMSARHGRRDPQEMIEIAVKKLRQGFEIISNSNEENPELEEALARARSETPHPTAH